jgi:hypothetical protein
VGHFSPLLSPNSNPLLSNSLRRNLFYPFFQFVEEKT